MSTHNGPIHESLAMDSLYLPSRAVQVAIQATSDRINEKVRLEWGIPGVDKRVVPFARGDMAVFLGRPGHGKTTLLVHLLRKWSEDLRAVGQSVMFATWETMVEEFMAITAARHSGYTLEDIGRGKADDIAVRDALVRTIGDNFVVFGKSERAAEAGMPGLHELEFVLSVMSKKSDLRVLFVDYLQRIPATTTTPDRAQRVSENAERIKDMAMRYGVTAIVAAQAARTVDEYRGLRFPAMSDAQWSSNIEQSADKLFGITMPGQYLPRNSEIAVGGLRYSVSASMVGIKMIKQRWGPVSDNDVWLLQLDHSTATISSAEPEGSSDDGPDELF